MQNRIQVKFLEMVVPYERGDTGFITEEMANSLGDKIERINTHKAILSSKKTKGLQHSQN